MHRSSMASVMSIKHRAHAQYMITRKINTNRRIYRDDQLCGKCWGIRYFTSADMAHLIDSGEFVIVQLPTEESDAGNQVH